jgi:hypothetical protein
MDVRVFCFIQCPPIKCADRHLEVATATARGDAGTPLIARGGAGLFNSYARADAVTR